MTICNVCPTEHGKGWARPNVTHNCDIGAQMLEAMPDLDDETAQLALECAECSVAQITRPKPATMCETPRLFDGTPDAEYIAQELSTVKRERIRVPNGGVA